MSVFSGPPFARLPAHGDRLDLGGPTSSRMKVKDR